MVSQMTLLINRIRKIVYRSTEKKTLVCNATIKFKLNNSVKVSIFINLVSLVIDLYLSAMFLGDQFILMTEVRSGLRLG